MLSFSGWRGVASNAPPGLQTTGIHQAILSLFPFRVFRGQFLLFPLACLADNSSPLSLESRLLATDC
jgi:hypothetical protein